MMDQFSVVFAGGAYWLCCTAHDMPMKSWYVIKKLEEINESGE